MNSEFKTQDSPVADAAYASLSRRAGAFIIDCVILGIIGGIAAHIIPVLGGIIAWFFYGPILESSVIRATIGKHLMGIQVADLMGRRISLRAALIRNALKLVSAAILFIGFIVALFNRKKQTLHDMLADTVVLYGRSEVPVVDAWMETSKEAFRAGKESLHTHTTPAGAESVVDQLERLQNLRNQGALTEEQYEAAKSKILGGQ